MEKVSKFSSFFLFYALSYFFSYVYLHHARDFFCTCRRKRKSLGAFGAHSLRLFFLFLFFLSLSLFMRATSRTLSIFESAFRRYSSTHNQSTIVQSYPKVYTRSLYEYCVIHAAKQSIDGWGGITNNDTTCIMQIVVAKLALRILLLFRDFLLSSCFLLLSKRYCFLALSPPLAWRRNTYKAQSQNLAFLLLSRITAGKLASRSSAKGMSFARKQKSKGRVLFAPLPPGFVPLRGAHLLSLGCL